MMAVSAAHRSITPTSGEFGQRKVVGFWFIDINVTEGSTRDRCGRAPHLNEDSARVIAPRWRGDHVETQSAGI